jgi:hypothetical protein
VREWEEREVKEKRWWADPKKKKEGENELQSNTFKFKFKN